MEKNVNQLEIALTSIEVAEMVEKAHNDLLKDIRRYCEQFSQGKIPQSDFFMESTYRTERGKEYPCFKVTKKGCEFIAHKLTGIKGTEFTAKYINRFHNMEEELRNPKTPMQILELEFAAIKEVDNKIESVSRELQELKRDMPILGIEIDKITETVRKRGVEVMGGKKSNAYNNRSLRGKVYNDIYRELKRQFGVTTYKAIKRNQCSAAITVIKDYKLPIALAEQVKDCNAQIKMEV